jgi:hypothetical protein
MTVQEIDLPQRSRVFAGTMTTLAAFIGIETRIKENCRA